MRTLLFILLISLQVKPIYSQDSIRLSYPYVLIHGLNSNGDKWEILKQELMNQGWEFGGLLNYCLNQDGNNSSSLLSEDVKSYVVPDSLDVGHFYIVNFNVDTNGSAYGAEQSCNSMSNQAGIYKQGYAIRLAIEEVLNKTGKDKVILFGHSMGGLASRTYLQKPELWADGQHHVAKIITTGTPHGGSNITSLNLGSVFGLADEKSEALRDLRTSYFVTGEPGVYLFGGVENDSYMDDSYLSDYYNFDVNCNGVEGDSITGLNQEDLPHDVFYSSIIGDYYLDVLGGDLAVSLFSANLNSFYSSRSEAFWIDESHSNLPLHLGMNFLGMDEADSAQWAYKIEPEITYHGFTSEQPVYYSANYLDDDYFYFKIEDAGNYSLTLDSLASDNGILYIYHNQNLGIPIQTAVSFNNSCHINYLFLDTGIYYLRTKTYAQPNALWNSPYNINITKNMITQNSPIAKSPNWTFFPNPSSDLINVVVETPSELTFLNTLSHEVKKHPIPYAGEHLIDISDLKSGIYILELRNTLGISHKRLVIR